MIDYDSQIAELRKRGAKVEAELEVIKKTVEELFRLKLLNEYTSKKYLFDKIEHYLNSISTHTYMRIIDTKNPKNQYVRVVPFTRMSDNEASIYYAIFSWTDESTTPYVSIEKVDNKKVDANYLQIIHYKVFKHYKNYTIKSPKGFNLNKAFKTIRQFYADFYNFENSSMTITAYSFKVCSDYSQKLLEPYFELKLKLRNFKGRFNL